MEVTYTEEGNSFVADEPHRWSEATLPFAAFNVSPDTSVRSSRPLPNLWTPATPCT